MEKIPPKVPIPPQSSKQMCEVIEGASTDIQRRIQKLLDDGCLIKQLDTTAVQYQAYTPRVIATVIYIAEDSQLKRETHRD